MNNSINYSGFVDILLDADDDYEPYGFGETSDSLENIYNCIQSYKAGFEDREYVYDL